MREEPEIERPLLSAPSDLSPLKRSASGITKRHKHSVLYTVCPYILGQCIACSSHVAAELTLHMAGNELCERLAFYGLATNLVTYVTQMIGGSAATGRVFDSSPFEKLNLTLSTEHPSGLSWYQYLKVHVTPPL
jgi:hypothetical protein